MFHVKYTYHGRGSICDDIQDHRRWSCFFVSSFLKLVRMGGNVGTLYSFVEL